MSSIRRTSRLTQSAIGRMGELIRAMTTGVNKDGDPLFPIMPYQLYASLKQEDLYSIITFVRGLKPIPHTTPVSKLEFPLNLIVRTIPDPSSPTARNLKNPGEYLTTIGGCIECHTPVDDRTSAFQDWIFPVDKNSEM